MPQKIPAAAVPPLQLTPQDDSELRQLATQLEHEIVAQYEHFLFHDQRRIDGSTWRHMRTDGGDLHAYKERTVKQRLGLGDALSKRQPGPHETLVQQSLLPRVLVAGTVPGTLDDIMYGLSFQDTSSLQSFWATQGGRVDESAVVAKLEGATLDDPYRFLGVVWLLREFPLHIRQRRDLLLLVSSGTMQLSNGERVGVSISHSIEHRDLAALHEFHTIRATSSLLKIYRQLDGNRVDVLITQLLDTKGSMRDYDVAQESIAHLLSLTARLNCAGFRRKLEWLLQRRKRDDLEATPCDAIEPQSSGANDHCELCDKKLGTLFSRPGTSCELCYQRVCTRCSASHALAVATSATKTTLKAHAFCIQCSLQTRATSTLGVAQSDAQYRSSTGSSSSTNSAATKSQERVRRTPMTADAMLLSK